MPAHSAFGRSSHASWRVLTLRMARQTALLHLNPEPKAICHTLSPRFTPCFVSMQASTYLHVAEPHPGCHAPVRCLHSCGEEAQQNHAFPHRERTMNMM